MEVPLFALFLALTFIADTYSVHPGCECLIFSATYGKEKGIFKSPDHPLPYPANIDCLLYTFVASSDEIIEIQFLEFDILKTQLSCIQQDFLKLFLHLESGDINEYTPWTALLCGELKELPSHTLYSSGPGLVLEFHTGPQMPKPSGFLGTFRFIDKKLFQIDGQKLPGTMCDYQFLASNYSPTYGKFYSPRYPSNYPKNVRCSYRFRARFKERIRVVFEEVSLQKGDLR
ncbi:suppressor of lurcher protein 1-like [Agrilus planipennis]|uniref:Suppressor of lurcher protein 1-like n=1 Tax=Agrilus planipennis TaxID=224129 RepID=A0A1W4WTI0_AGRPL|nr:suppressor of lurcher protein 1-like [Agrilus planipennis]XP_018323337.1 suppressor of lurcher protein 1-like [Agrilus planipennis]